MRLWGVFLFSLGLSGSLHANECSAPFSGPQNPAYAFAQSIEKSGFQYFRIDRREIEAFAEKLARKKFPLNLVDWNFPPYPMNESIEVMFPYFLTLSSINYMYWHPQTLKTFGTTIEEKGEKFWMAGAGLLARRLTSLQGSPLLSPEGLANLTLSQAKEHLFGGEIPAPYPKRRVNHLKEVGLFLLNHESSSWKELLETFETPIDLVKYLSDHLSGFQDPFLKRAQLFVGMLIGRFYQTDEIPERLKNLDDFTVYADYLLPVFCIRYGLIIPDPDVLAKILSHQKITRGSRIELEMRAVTILAARELRNQLRSYPDYQKINDLMIDGMMWTNMALLTKEIPGLPEELQIPKEWVKANLLQHPLIDTTDY